MLALYKNIKKKREELGLSQDDLAQKTGYTSRSSIAKIEKGLVDLPQTKIEIFAKALNTSPQELMGWDFCEDENIVRFDDELKDAMRIIENAGYSLSFSDEFNSAIIIKNNANEIVTCLNDYELVNKYESLQRKGTVDAESLIEDKDIQHTIDKAFAFDRQLKVLGWTYKVMSEPDAMYKDRKNSYVLFKNEKLSFKASLEDCDAFINDAELFYKERIQLLLKKSMKQMFTNNLTNESHLMPVAAHERTDIEVTEEMRKHDDAFFDE